MEATAINKKSENFQYVQLANEVELKIKEGVFNAGDKLPSLRKMWKETGLSISTVHLAYIELEKRGFLEAREKSGFYIKPSTKKPLPLPQTKKIKSVPKRYSNTELAYQVVEILDRDDFLKLGCATASIDLHPGKQLTRIIRGFSHKQLEDAMFRYGDPAGSQNLRHELAKLLLGKAGNVTEDNIIVTNACVEAVRLSLLSVAKAGDTVLVESPAFYTILQVIDDLGMYALECPINPDTGVDPAVLEKLVKEKKPAVCILTPNYQNPTGSCVSDQNKKKIVKIAAKYQTPIIEDDVYGDLYFGERRPRTLKSFDTDGWILYCSSFSKTLPAAGLRIGYVIPGKFYGKLKKHKLNCNISTSLLNQLIIAEYLKDGAYERHLKKFRNTLKNQMCAMRSAIARYFPAGTKITYPEGGILLWIQLDEKIDALEVYKKAMEYKISIIPGIICSSTGSYKNFIRINAGNPWSEKLEQGIKILASIIEDMI